MRVYVASSWRNDRQPGVVAALRHAGHEVYDFRNPAPGDEGFHWSEIDRLWELWGPEEFVAGLPHPIAQQGLAKNLAAMEWAEAFVLVNPGGRSSHLEAGWAIGAGKPLLILLDKGEPELMYGLASHLHTSIWEVVKRLEEYR